MMFRVKDSSVQKSRSFTCISNVSQCQRLRKIWGKSIRIRHLAGCHDTVLEGTGLALVFTLA